MSTEQKASAILENAKALVAPVISEALADLNSELRTPTQYHYSGQGKGTRPALALLSAEVASASHKVGLPGAVAIELIHDFSLIHDDIIDSDTERRHRRTVWAKYGVGTGVITGDALHALAYQALLCDPTPVRVRAAHELTKAVSAMIAGQSMDMAFENLPKVTVEQCLAMEQGKTGALLSFAASVGAILAEADEQIILGLAKFGMHLGIAFQAVDDLLGIWGDSTKTGKPASSDLRERKKTLPVVIVLNSTDAAAAELASIYADSASHNRLSSKSILDEPTVHRARSIIEAGEGHSKTRALAYQHFEIAVTALNSVSKQNSVNSNAIEKMRCLADFICGRDF